METQKAIELLERNKAGLCHGCVHPAMVGWCKNHCGLPEAFDMAINALKVQEVSNNSPELDSDFGELISRDAAIDALAEHEKSRGHNYTMFVDIVSECAEIIRNLPSAQPEVKPIGYQDCANAMLKMWMDKVITDGEYNRIMEKLNMESITRSWTS